MPPLISPPPIGSAGPARTARPGAAGERGRPRACGAHNSRPAPRVWSDRFEVGRPRPPPLPALREAARVRRSSRGRGARGGVYTRTRRPCALSRGAREGRGRGAPRPAPGCGSRGPASARGTLTGEASVSRAALPLPEAERYERMELESAG